MVYGDELVLAFCDIRPFTRGHTLVIAKRHASGLHELDAADGQRMFEVARRLAGAVRAAVGCPGVNLHLADGAVAGQTVFHAHLHVIPRWRRRELLRLVGGRPRPTRAELDATASAIAAAMT